MAGDNHNFSKTLLSLMKEKKMTVQQAAKTAGIGSSTIQAWRSGGQPTDFVAIKRLAKKLGVSFSFLLTGEDDSRAKEDVITITEVFKDGGTLFDGFAKITIQRLLPRAEKEE